MEHVDDQITEVQEHPTRLGTPLPPQTLVSGRDEPPLDLIGDRGDIALAAAGHKEEDVDEGQRLRDIQRDEILAALAVRGTRRDREHLTRLRAGGHAKTPVTKATTRTPMSAAASTPAVMASVSMSALPFSGAGGRMISLALLTVLTAALAAIGGGDDAAGSSVSARARSASRPSARALACPREPSPSGRL